MPLALVAMALACLFFFLSGEKKAALNTSGGALFVGPELEKSQRDFIESANSKLDVVLYTAIYKPEADYYPPNRLLKSLVKRFSKGVGLRVILDVDLNWDEKQNSYSNSASDKNKAAWQFLKDSGVPVRLNGPQRGVHITLLLADQSQALWSTAGWSYSGLRRNAELGILVEESKTPQDFSRLESLFEELWNESDKDAPDSWQQKE